jgi:hypothetical protein
MNLDTLDFFKISSLIYIMSPDPKENIVSSDERSNNIK